MLLERLRELWPWHEIRGCPGRFVVSKVGDHVPPEQLLVKICEKENLDRTVMVRSRTFKHSHAGDDVFVAVFLDAGRPPHGGGLITYCKKNGSFVHTMNEPQGLERKLTAMGFEYILEEASSLFGEED